MKTTQQADRRSSFAGARVLVAFVAAFAALSAMPVGDAPAASGEEPTSRTGVLAAGAQIVAPASGDLNCDGEVSAADALHVLRYVARLPGVPDCLFAADVQCDNDRDAVDALLILRHIASLPPAITPPGCPGIGQPLPDNPELAGGVLVSAVQFDESYHVWLTNETGIAMAYDLAWNRLPWGYQRGYFAGPLRLGSGAGEHNAPWSWHLDPDETIVAEGVIEICTGRLEFVEQDVQAWIEQVGQFCAGISELVSIVDYRWMTEVSTN